MLEYDWLLASAASHADVCPGLSLVTDSLLLAALSTRWLVPLFLVSTNFRAHWMAGSVFVFYPRVSRERGGGRGGEGRRPVLLHPRHPAGAAGKQPKYISLILTLIRRS